MTVHIPLWIFYPLVIWLGACVGIAIVMTIGFLIEAIRNLGSKGLWDKGG